MSIHNVLTQLRNGELTVEQAQAQLTRLQREQMAQPLGFATLDHERQARCGVPEVVYAAGKTPDQVKVIVAELIERNPAVLATRCDAAHLDALRQTYPAQSLEIGPRCGTVIVGRPPQRDLPAIPIVTAGTSDEPVAEEARLTCTFLGHPTVSINDVGVAGLHRLNDRIETIRSGRVVICIAGMEGALPSVIGGLVSVPVIAVPTSVGYGAAFEGIAALLGMMTSCAAGVVTVNIDNGFGAAYAACLISDQGRARGA